MRFVIQRVKKAVIRVEGGHMASIGEGFVVLVGVSDTDTKEIADKMVSKLVKMRIFEDEEGKTNRSLADVDGSILMVSQFTLYADCKKGNRPSFIKAGAPDLANELYEYCILQTREAGVHVETGEFGADMKVSSENDGPVTIVIDR